MIFLTLAYRNVLRNRERSTLTLVGVLLAVGSFVALVSLAEGLYTRVDRELNGRDVDIYVVPDTTLLLPTGPVGTLGLTSDVIDLSWLEPIEALPNVRDAAGIIRQQWTGESGILMVLALDPARLQSCFPYAKIRGRLMEDGQAMLGAGLVALEGKKVGDYLRYGQRRYRITGLVESRGGFQDYFAYLPLSTALKQDGRPGVQEVWVQVEDPYRARETAQAIDALKIPGVHAYTRQQYLGRAHQYIRYVWLLQFAVAAIGVLISITAAMNTMLMSTYERLREFATLRAIGASRGTVVAMILTESVLLCTAGGLLGVGFGWLGSYLLDRAVMVLLQLSFPLASVTWKLVFQAVLLSVFVGLMGAVIPAFLVWRLHLVDGLRWE